MNCELVLRNDIYERYLRGELDPSLQDAFEEHYFGCEPCSEALEMRGLLKDELARAVPLSRTDARFRRRRVLWVGAAAAALMILSIGLWTSRLTSPVTPNELAAFAPPPYAQLTLRGAQDDSTSVLRQAMTHYNEGDYGAAVEGLRRAVRLNPSAPRVRFFLGISLLLTGRTDDGIAALHETISLGESPYLEETHFYLAKAHLRTDSRAAAKAELEAVVRMDGALKAEAEGLLARLETP